jgi:AcrR family transcriptional regulator
MIRKRTIRAHEIEKPYHHGNLHQKLIEAGLELIEEKGVRALTFREIGSRLGVSRTAPYRHFADKATLLAAICEAGFSEFANALEAARRNSPPEFAARFDALGVAYVRFAAQHRAHFEVMFGSGAPGGQSAERAFGILEETIREGQAAGQVRAGDSASLARIAWSLVHGISMLGLEQRTGGRNPKAEFTLFSSLVLRTGLQAPA